MTLEVENEYTRREADRDRAIEPTKYGAKLSQRGVVGN